MRTCIVVVAAIVLAFAQPRVAEAGIELFPVPTADSSSVGIVAGSDRAL